MNDYSGSLTRRRVLAASGATIAGLAGCLGGMGAETEPADGEATEDSDSLVNHPAAVGLTDQPRLGPDPSEAAGVIIAFEDPSCTRCRAFERETFPRVRSELIDPGDVAFVFRGYPVVYPWGKPATQALESTFARDEDAFWALKTHYYDEQPSFSAENVLSKTREFLAAETDLDADAVVADAEAKRHDDAVQADISAAENAGAGRTTPTIFLFADGAYRTKAAGSVSFGVISNALDL